MSIRRNRALAVLAMLAVLGLTGCRSGQPSEDETKAQQAAAPADQAARPDTPGQPSSTPGSGGGAAPGAQAGGAAPDTGRADTRAQATPQSLAPAPREYTIPSDTRIPVRTTTTLSTEHAVDGSAFTGLLERDLVVDGTVLAKEGSSVTGVVVSSDPGGRVKGVASLAVAITAIAGADGQPIRVRTRSYTAVAPKSTGRDVKRGGIMTGAGAAVGAIAGGGKGAAIGAGVGAAAGVGTAMATRGKPAVIPAETLIQFRLASPATVVRL